MSHVLTSFPELVVTFYVKKKNVSYVVYENIDNGAGSLTRLVLAFKVKKQAHIICDELNALAELLKNQELMRLKYECI